MEILNFKQKPTEEVISTIGFFDGVHRGHQYLFEQLKTEAKKRNMKSSVITFPIHPRKVLQADFQPELLCEYEEKIKHLKKANLDYIFPVQFSKELSRLSAREFMQKLKDNLNVTALLIGYDHKFGHNRADEFEDYVRYGKEIGMEVIRAKELNSEIDTISSSTIRRYLHAGEITKANAQLGYHYSVTGKVVTGFQIGRTIGFPTANMRLPDIYKLVPVLGIYAVNVCFDNKSYGGMLYIGTRPTVHDDSFVSIEVNIFNFDGDLYGKTINVEFIDFIRFDEKFENIELLKENLEKDKKMVLKVLKEYKYYPF